MSIQQLTTVVTPPQSPIDTGSPAERKTVENRLGVALPNDFIDLATVYGSGSFDRGQFFFYNPFSEWYIDNIDEIHDIFRDLKQSEGNEFIPFDIYPDSPGLLLWGNEANGHCMFWLTEGESDSWPILIYDRDYDRFERWDMSVTSFIAGVFTGDVTCTMWSRKTQEKFRPLFEQ